MKKLLKVLCYLIVLVMIASFLGIGVSAQQIDYKTYKDFVYTEHDNPYGGVTVTNYKGTKKSITIPSEFKGKKVTMVTPLNKAKTVETLKIPASVRYVKISQAPMLKKIIISKNNKYLKSKDNLVLNKKGTTVRSCAGAVANVKIPDTVKVIYHQAFSGAKIKTATFGKKVKKVDSYAFYNCRNLTTVTTKKGVKSIENNAFDGCKNLSKVIINNTKVSPDVDDFAFNRTKAGIKFIVKNSTVAKQLKNELNESGVNKAKIYVGTKLYYNDIY